MKKALKIFKKAPYPALVTIISFILFIGLYLLFTLTVVNPYYIKGLIFIIPFLCFGIVTFYTAADKLITIYLIEGKPYKQNNWNHGKISLIAISTQRNELIFYAEDW